ncbi:ABC transporter permease DevC [Schlesneria sp. T3-172]|uniref:ABC transporter permease DevC n=1 Tax=Schlesneria sphaerica TaxID=3373610 RepID=UPI0037C7ACB2
MTPFLTRLMGRLPIGWLQLKHNRTRLLAAVGGVTFANVLIFMQLGFMNALFETSVITHRNLVADIVLVSSDFRSLREANPLPRTRMYQAMAIPGVTEATPVFMSTMMWTDPATGDTTNFRVIGIVPSGEVFLDEKLQQQVPLLREPDSAIVDRRTRDFRREIETVIQEQGEYLIESSGRQLSLRGVFSHGASFDVDGLLIVSEQTFLSLFPKRAAGTPTVVLLKCASGTDPLAIARQIDQHFPERDVLALTKQEFIDAEQNYQSRQTPIGFVFGFGVAIGVIVGLVMVYQVLSTDVQDHLAEYATLKAIGYSPRYFLGIVFEEAVCLATLGFVPGLCVSLVLYAVAARATALPIAMTWSRPLFVLLLTAVMCVISGAVATRRLNSADPADLF